MEDIGKLHCIPGIHILYYTFTFNYFHCLGGSSVGPVFARLAAGKSIAVTGIFALASRFVPSNGCKENEKNTEAMSTLALNLRPNSEISRARQSMCIRMRMHAFSWLSPSQTMPEYPLDGWIGVYIKHQHLQYVAMTRLCHQQDLKAILAYPSLLWPTVSSEAAVQKLQGKLSNCNVTSLCIRRFSKGLFYLVHIGTRVPV